MLRRENAMAACAALLAWAATGCSGEITNPTRGEPRAAAPRLECAVSDNDAIRLRLQPTCGSCHGAGTSHPFFASLSAFEDLLVYDTRFVVGGAPDDSELLRMLEGQGTGAYAQMPLDGAPFATRAERGETAITMAELRDWVTNLGEASGRPAVPDPAAASTRRLDAGEVIAAIQLALGAEPTGAHHPLLDVDGTPPLSPDSPTLDHDYRNPERAQVYAMLGGASYLAQTRPEERWSPSSVTAITQLAQGACSRAVARNNPQLFVEASPSDTLPDGEAAIRANLARLYTRFLHEDPTDADIDALLNDVYAPGEAVSPRTGWTHVCTALIRDPLFLMF